MLWNTHRLSLLPWKTVINTIKPSWFSSTFYWDQLCKICRNAHKERLQISKDAFGSVLFN